MAAKHVSVFEDWMHDSFNYSNNLHRQGQNGVFVRASERWRHVCNTTLALRHSVVMKALILVTADTKIAPCHLIASDKQVKFTVDRHNTTWTRWRQ